LPRFGSTLNGNIHFHGCIIDGRFNSKGEAVRFDEAAITSEDIAKIQTQVTERVLGLFKRSGLLSPEAVDVMRGSRDAGGCGGELKIIAFLTEADPVRRILIHIGEPITPPRLTPARAPADWIEIDFDQTVPDESENLEPVPEFEFDQTVSW
jgi:Putative transposase